MKQTKPSNEISTSKNFGQRNKSSKIAKKCSFTRYKTSRSNKIIDMFVNSKNEKKKAIFAGHFLRTEIDSSDFKNESLTAKIRRNKAEKPYFLKTISQNILKQTKPSNKIRT